MTFWLVQHGSCCQIYLGFFFQCDSRLDSKFHQHLESQNKHSSPSLIRGRSSGTTTVSHKIYVTQISAMIFFIQKNSYIFSHFHIHCCGHDTYILHLCLIISMHMSEFRGKRTKLAAINHTHYWKS